MLQLLDFNVAFQADAVGLPSPMPQTVFTSKQSSQALLQQLRVNARLKDVEQSITVVVCLVDPHYKPTGLNSSLSCQARTQVNQLIQAFLQRHPQMRVLKACRYSPCFKGVIQAKFLTELIEDTSVALAYAEETVDE